MEGTGGIFTYYNRSSRTGKAAAEDRRLRSGTFYKFRPAFGAGNLYLSVAFGDADFLFTGRAGIDTEIFALLCQVLLTAEKVQHLILFGEKPLVFLEALLIIFGKHAEIKINHSGDDQKIQRRSSEKGADNAQDEQDAEQKSG